MRSPRCSGKRTRLTRVGVRVQFLLNTWQESELGALAMRYVFFSLELSLKVRVWAAMPA